ncbi:MAG TPA: MotA/TolQ/ExbB proton channel family protein [Candidatus Onthomorpha intestinigallinarum]|uniref:MotA/TolQ/ExbB proton channel family protein n=1 Tax=Candidatus Onthomorpha intestinigallinarum TaxID=2840880 RepID=A0A9D1UI18_9BACT|nr:MotA/TolQ/ExbB proton channel family protein [Candidatus Onthomorpha intestinigallinarum]
MKKVCAYLSIVMILTLGLSNVAFANAAKDAESETATVSSTETAVTAEPAVAETTTPAPAEEQSFHQALKTKYIEGGVGWMTPILICLILGLALVIERILYLNLATTNADKLLKKIEERVIAGDIEGAKDVCRNTRGPVASIFYQGLDRVNNGLEDVEKSLTSYGGVQMARLESNMVWISLFIALAPSFGFLGTVVGMVQAFDDIEKAGDISPTVVAGGMKVALLTTVFGLITALALQICYNYLLSKIEGLVATMEDSSITFMDILVKNLKK